MERYGGEIGKKWSESHCAGTQGNAHSFSGLVQSIWRRFRNAIHRFAARFHRSAEALGEVSQRMRQHESPQVLRLHSKRTRSQQKRPPFHRGYSLLRESLHRPLLQKQRPGHHLQKIAAAVAREGPTGLGLLDLPACLHDLMLHSIIKQLILILYESVPQLQGKRQSQPLLVNPQSQEDQVRTREAHHRQLAQR